MRDIARKHSPDIRQVIKFVFIFSIFRKFSVFWTNYAPRVGINHTRLNLKGTTHSRNALLEIDIMSRLGLPIFIYYVREKLRQAHSGFKSSKMCNLEKSYCIPHRLKSTGFFRKKKLH